MAGRLARQLLNQLGTVAVVAGLSGGCLLPQDDQVIPDLPPRKNRPPRILETYSPPQTSDLQVGLGCRSSVEFWANVEDPDLADVIRSRFFVDPKLTQDGLDPSNDYKDGTSIPAPATSPQRSSPAKLVFSLSAGRGLALSGEHQVHVLIADGELQNNNKPLNLLVALPDGGLAEDVKYVDTFVWVINTEEKDCR